MKTLNTPQQELKIRHSTLQAFTAQNTVILPYFLVWKFCQKAQFPHRNRAFPQNFHARKSGEITIFFAVFDIILRHIVEEIKNAKFYSVLAGEVTSYNKEELAVFLRFVVKDKYIKEAFVGFLPRKRITGVYVLLKQL